MAVKVKQPALLAPLHRSNGVQKYNLLDPEYEYLDPNPDLHQLFAEYNMMFFDGKLAGCEVKWSKRMTLCESLLKLRPRSDMINTLLHEMIHAYVFVSSPIKDHDDHGPIFQSHMHRINQTAGTKITVFHTFHGEVDFYRQHWWQCDGRCRRAAPYFGLVKRAMNRVPGPRDPWWSDHQKNCGGTYTKIKEPPGYTQKQAKKKQKKVSSTPSVKDYFQTLPSEQTQNPARNANNLSTMSTQQNEEEMKKPIGKKRRRDGDDIENVYGASVIFAAGDDDDEFFLAGDIQAILYQQVDVEASSAVTKNTANANAFTGFVDLTNSDDEQADAEEKSQYLTTTAQRIRIPGDRPICNPFAKDMEIIEID